MWSQLLLLSACMAAMCVTLTDGRTQYFPHYTEDNGEDPSSKVSGNISETELKPHHHHHNHHTEDYGNQPLCPEPADIAPCLCTYHIISKATDIDCSAIESEEQFRNIFHSDFPVKKFRKLFIQANNNLKVLESDVFNGVSFEKLVIIWNNLEVIEMHSLGSCYETLHFVQLYKNMITKFPFDELSLFSKLTYFDISDNKLSLIPANAFNGLMALEVLDIRYNTPNIVGNFENLPNLRSIYLDNSELTSIQTKFINTGSSRLYYIGLRGNNIVSVEPGSFDILEGLEVNLDYNLLSTLEEETWRPLLEAGGILSVKSNPLLCGCDIAWLFEDDHLIQQVRNSKPPTTCTNGEDLHLLDPTIFEQC